MSETIKDIVLYIPNLIGYLRIILALLAFGSSSPLLFSLLYSASQVLDAFDGKAARYFNQSTRFGGLLDQLTDRCSFLGLLFYLSDRYKNYAFILLMVIIIDISSHWAHLYATVLLGKDSHKSNQENYFLNLYYSNKTIFFLLCVCNDCFFIALYLLAFSSSQYYSFIFAIVNVTAPFMLSKVFINIVQCYQAFKSIAKIDIGEREK